MTRGSSRPSCRIGFYAETGYDRAIRAICARQADRLPEAFWTLTANSARPRSRHGWRVGLDTSTDSGADSTSLSHAIGRRTIDPEPRSETHMREDLSIFEFELTGAERRAMDKVFVEKPLKFIGELHPKHPRPS